MKPKPLKVLKTGKYIPKNRTMINKEYKILHCFAKEPWRKYTFTELQKASKKKSKSYLYSVLMKFVKDDILKQELIGRLPVYSINITSPKAREFAGFVLEFEGWDKPHIPYKNLEKAMEKIPTKGYIFIVTGSYAARKQTENSDIDVVVIIDDSAEPKKTYAELSHYCELNIPLIHLYVFKNKEFIRMLCNKEPNYGKMIIKNNLILSGGEIYIALMKEAIENGFNG